jgi:hypothetical protein
MSLVDRHRLGSTRSCMGYLPNRYAHHWAGAAMHVRSSVTSTLAVTIRHWFRTLLSVTLCRVITAASWLSAWRRGDGSPAALTATTRAVLPVYSCNPRPSHAASSAVGGSGTLHGGGQPSSGAATGPAPRPEPTAGHVLAGLTTSPCNKVLPPAPVRPGRSPRAARSRRTRVAAGSQLLRRRSGESCGPVSLVGRDQHLLHACPCVTLRRWR